MGIVSRKVPVAEFEASEVLPTAGFRGRGFSCASAGERKYLMGRATREQQMVMIQKQLEEAEVLEVTRLKVEEKMLPLIIYEAG